MLLGSAACAQQVRPPEVTPAELSVLETRQNRAKDDPDELLAIGVAFYRAGVFERSRDVLLAVLALRPQNGEAAIQLGLAHEALGQFPEALAAYQRAATLKLSRSNRKAAADRSIAVTHLLLAAEARRAIAAESSLSIAAPIPNTVAVLPWSYLGTNQELEPLERGLTHLVLTDLAKLSRFTLLERERVQALTEELALSDSGRVLPETAARSGRLLRAAQVIQGSLRENGSGGLRLDAAVVNASTAEVRASGSAEDRLSELFAMEKTLVLGLLERMGISLTPAEQRALAERPTADLQAFLAFSRGLEAEDQGRFQDAAVQFGRAANRDPGFTAAVQRAAASRQTAAAIRVTPARLAQKVQLSLGGESGLGIRGTTSAARGAQLATLVQAVAPTLAGHLALKPGRQVLIRARLAEALRQDDPSRIGKLLDVIPRP